MIKMGIVNSRVEAFSFFGFQIKLTSPKFNKHLGVCPTLLEGFFFTFFFKFMFVFFIFWTISSLFAEIGRGYHIILFETYTLVEISSLSNFLTWKKNSFLCKNFKMFCFLNKSQDKKLNWWSFIHDLTCWKWLDTFRNTWRWVNFQNLSHKNIFFALEKLLRDF